ncbi:MAG: Gfo/Idh/MocA family oxidoreductase [Lachnospiraceae bacterium]|nr:Gfo/Idh/MocA family oxidoreductase [Lachnospiraceae bacterium]
MQKVNWGVLGTANIARGCTIPGMKLSDNCKLQAIAGRSLEKAMAFKEEFGFEKAYGSYEELIEDKDVQAVYIPLPNDLHIKWVNATLKSGKHVLCEKPLALNVEEAKKMYETAAENGVILMEAYAYLHSPYVESLKKDVGSGIIGDIDYIESAFLTQGYKEDFRLYREHGGGAMYDLGCYCTTMILSLVDSDPVFVKAEAEFSDLGVDLITTAILRFENGVRASFKVGMILGENTNSRLDRLYIHGSTGCKISDVEYNQEGELGYRIISKGEVIERKVSVPQNYSLEITQLGRCILNGEKPHITPEFSLKNAELMDEVFEQTGYFSLQ